MVTYPLQDDNVNCGIYMLSYIRGIINDIRSLSPIDPVDVRLEMARLCINQSKEIMNESDLSSAAKNLLGKRYENVLSRNVQYYSAIEEDSDEFAICLFGSGVRLLDSHDFDRLLSPEKWLSGAIIDAAIHVHMNDELRKLFVNVSCYMSTNLVIKSTVRKEDIIINVVLSGKTLLMPILVNENHWCLIIANITKKTCRLLDPLDVSNASKYLDKFIKFNT